MSFRDFLVSRFPRWLPGQYERIARTLFAQVYREVVDRAAGFTDARRVLDFGTGPGIVALDLAAGQSGQEISAVDISDNALIAAEDEAERRKLRQRVRFGLIDEGRFPWPEETFDLILVTFVVHCEARDPERLLETLYERLSPGGSCWIVECVADFNANTPEIIRALRLAGAAPKWLPDLPIQQAIESLRSPLLTRPRLEAAVRDSQFGVAQWQWRPLNIGPLRLPDALAWLELQRPDVTLTSDAGH